ncbi:Myc-type, basic helix-loop-helix (bHLH) domain-containing protein [Artemisia annua]|uniref:Myc-type, basic helix-loop-helix (BHLH) domain-containing protein n=1 Tax=Artemisia annua TaxID=35608 RepID=A0A2U1P347_ARTAN|nr:Myc-type, basic helix-loop-helix (bHLH) domain-containing protein [Artemisia annua]
MGSSIMFSECLNFEDCGVSLLRFVELSSTLEPGRSVTTDKLAIIGDVIRVLNQLKSESQECKEMNEKLLEEIKTFRIIEFSSVPVTVSSDAAEKQSIPLVALKCILELLFE